MSKYTTQVRRICESYAGNPENLEYAEVKDIIEKARPKVFSFEYPIFDPTYKGVLETKILKHFYTREIAHETVGLWKLRLDTKMNEIMPYYNKLYQSETLQFNPLHDVDVSTTHKNEVADQRHNEGTVNGVATSDNTQNQTASKEGTRHDTLENTTLVNESGTYQDHTASDESKTTAVSDTPQGALDDIRDLRYLTRGEVVDGGVTGNNNGTTSASNSNVSTGSNTTTDNVAETLSVENNATQNNEVTTVNDTNVTSVEDFIESVTGKQGGGTYSAMLNEYRTTLLNIDMMVINELNDLFFTIY